MKNPDRFKVACIFLAGMCFTLLISNIHNLVTTVEAQKSGGGDTYRLIFEGISKYGQQMDDGYPEMMKEFKALRPIAYGPGALDAKTKEFIGLGISVANRCDVCIGYHTHRLLSLGATDEEIIEVLGVALYLGGGPSYAYATHVMEAMEEFRGSE